MSRVVVIGGGITGLAAAHHLQRIAPGLQIVLLERSRRLGGKILTVRDGPFLLEAGPDSFLTSKPRGLGLCEELGLTGRLQGTRGDTRGTYVMRDGRLHPMPEGLTGLVPSRLEPLLESELFSPGAKERLRQEPNIPPGQGSDDETLASFVERRFGPEVYERLIEPLMGGIYAGDGHELSLEATFPQLRRLELEWGSLIRGIEASRPAAPSSLPAFVAPMDGMGAIVSELQNRLRPSDLRQGATAVSVERRTDGLTVRTDDGSGVDADAVILSVSAFAAGDLLSHIEPHAAHLLAGIPYASTATVYLAYPRNGARVLVGHGYVIPRREGRPTLACTFVSQKFAHRAPPEMNLYRVFIGRRGREEPLAGIEDGLIDIARTELRQTLGIGARPALARVFRWERAMPQYTIGHLDRLHRIEARIGQQQGLFLAGALEGVGIPDCIRSGESVAERVAAHLGLEWAAETADARTTPGV